MMIGLIESKVDGAETAADAEARAAAAAAAVLGEVFLFRGDRLRMEVLTRVCISFLGVVAVLEDALKIAGFGDPGAACCGFAGTASGTNVAADGAEAGDGGGGADLVATTGLTLFTMTLRVTIPVEGTTITGGRGFSVFSTYRIRTRFNSQT